MTDERTTVTKTMRTETGHRLTKYSGLCSHAHGHSYFWEVTAVGELDERGMVADFKDLKKAMSIVLDPFDHAMVLQKDDPLVKVIEIVPATNGDKQRLLTFDWNPTAENFAAYAGITINGLMPKDVTITEVTVWETASSFATWRNQDVNQ